MNERILDETEVDLYTLAEKLDRLIELLSSQNEIASLTTASLDKISNKIPRESGISTYHIENKLEDIWDKLDDIGEMLNSIKQ